MILLLLCVPCGRCTAHRCGVPAEITNLMIPVRIHSSLAPHTQHKKQKVRVHNRAGHEGQHDEQTRESERVPDVAWLVFYAPLFVLAALDLLLQDLFSLLLSPATTRNLNQAEKSATSSSDDYPLPSGAASLVSDRRASILRLLCFTLALAQPPDRTVALYCSPARFPDSSILPSHNIS